MALSRPAATPGAARAPCAAGDGAPLGVAGSPLALGAVQIVYIDGDHRRELDVRVNNPAATVDDLARALDPTAADRALLIGDRVADPDFDLAEAGLHEGAEVGWSDPLTLVGLAVGVVAAIAFVVWELHRGDASLLDVRLFRERGLASGSIRACTAPARSGTARISEVWSRPEGGLRYLPTTWKRVRFIGSSWMPCATGLRPYNSSASSPAIAAMPGSAAAMRAPSALLETGVRSIPG